MAGREAEGGLYEEFQKARRGDEQALNRLLGTLRPMLLREIRSRVRSAMSTEALAEELTQEALVRVAEGLPTCRARSGVQLRAWCRTIARRIVIDWHRRRRAEIDRRARGEVEELVSAMVRHVPGGAGGQPDREAPGRADQTLGRLLLEAQSVLSAGTCEVIRRRLLYGDSWEEAGRMIGATAGGAKRRWQRARARLRREVLMRADSLPENRKREVLKRLGGADPE